MDRTKLSAWGRGAGGGWASLLVTVLAVAWVGYRFHEVRTSASDMLVEVERLERETGALKGKLGAYEEGFLGRPVRDLGPTFLRGFEWVAPTGRLPLHWREPTDGIYLVVDLDCPRSEEAVRMAEEVAQDGGREVILLDADSASGAEWLRRLGPQMQRRVVTPSTGWWSVGIPSSVTPVWFAVAGGQVVDVGVGKSELADFAFDPRTPKSIAFSEPVYISPEEDNDNEKQ